MRSCKGWDLPDGDAELLESVPDNTYDFVHSSHCLEHMQNPYVALKNWLRVLKPGGHLICLVPDEDLYEQGIFPSTYNSDHKWTFSIFKKRSWSSHTINIMEMLSHVDIKIQILKIELLDATYRYNIRKITQQGRFDQTTTAIGESAIEFILKKTA